jgi:hypothetical protein
MAIPSGFDVEVLEVLIHEALAWKLCSWKYFPGSGRRGLEGKDVF